MSIVTIAEACKKEFDELFQLFKQAEQVIRGLTADLNQATAKINEQRGLIEHLSQDNLKLVAKLDELTGKKAPGTGFAA